MTTIELEDTMKAIQNKINEAWEDGYRAGCLYTQKKYEYKCIECPRRKSCDWLDNCFKEMHGSV